ncbi:hypothetical protein [Pedobacter metabolipauper]|uniref:FAD dependent oxidoreductase n=1 Tax=Pedobacter metabolipauper TaxID=425513 RepID=A0A4R6SW47_9SPHI|nr:hypothetical protein [Pedobacter metabolipauper]TDQ09599.1 hypothetical protein ATK78_1755 [Pedobacter metabolipauper]
MKRGFLLVAAGILLAQVGSAQTIKTGVLVIGNGNSAVGAAIQSSVSGVKTVILMKEAGFESPPFSNGQVSGLAADLLKRKQASPSSNINDVLKIWTDSLKNLTVIKNTPFTKLKRSGSGWSVQLSNGKSIKAQVLIHADRSGSVDAALQLQKVQQQWETLNYETNTYRTSIAAGTGSNGTGTTILSLYQLFLPDQENLIVLNTESQSITAGQAAGATAAYAVFFKAKTSKSNLKTIQGELINYKLSVMPFTDVSSLDSNWKSIQFIGLSGFLKADLSSADRGESVKSIKSTENNGQATAIFGPDKLVSAAEIAPTVKEYYYKAQIWFDDYKQSDMTIGATLGLICFVGNKSLENTRNEVIKKWGTVYHFKTAFDEKRSISRREFSVLVNEYLKPFNVNIDNRGRVLR